MNTAPQHYEQTEEAKQVDDYNHRVASTFCAQVIDAVELLVQTIDEELTKEKSTEESNAILVHTIRNSE